VFGEITVFDKKEFVEDMIERGLNRYNIVSEARAEIHRTESRLHLAIGAPDSRAEGSRDHVRFLRALVFFLLNVVKVRPENLSDDEFQILLPLAQHLVDRGDFKPDVLELFGGGNWLVPRKFEWTKKDLRALPKSKREAIAEGGRFYSNGRLCRYGHLCPRRLNGHCLECNRKISRDYHRRLSVEKRGLAEWQDGRGQKMVNLDALIESGLLTSRQEAKKSGSKYYFTGDPCLNGHLSPRYRGGKCVQCNRDWSRRTADKRKAK